MIKNRSEILARREIDLSGPQGNAFCILGYAKDFCRQLEKDFAPIEKEMTSGDYENLIAVFDREFGDFVTLYRANDAKVKDEDDKCYDDDEETDDYDDEEDDYDDDEEEKDFA